MVKLRDYSERDKSDWVIPVVMLFVTVLCLSLGWYIYSSFEATAFNRVTGKSVSTWDAMFLDLRVQEPTKQESD